MKKVNVTKKEKSVLQGKLTRLAVQIGKAGQSSGRLGLPFPAALAVAANYKTVLVPVEGHIGFKGHR